MSLEGFFSTVFDQNHFDKDLWKRRGNFLWSSSRIRQSPPGRQSSAQHRGLLSGPTRIGHCHHGQDRLRGCLGRGTAKASVQLPAQVAFRSLQNIIETIIITIVVKQFQDVGLDSKYSMINDVHERFHLGFTCPSPECQIRPSRPPAPRSAGCEGLPGPPRGG